MTMTMVMLKVNSYLPGDECFLKVHIYPQQSVKSFTHGDDIDNSSHRGGAWVPAE